MAQGVELMLIGMGTVFVFLTTLVGATTLMSALAGNESEPGPAATAVSGGDGPDAEELAAISAAITRHRQR